MRNIFYKGNLYTLSEYAKVRGITQSQAWREVHADKVQEATDEIPVIRLQNIQRINKERWGS